MLAAIYLIPSLQGSGFRVQSSGIRVQGSGLRVQGSGFRDQVSESRVKLGVYRVGAAARIELVDQHTRAQLRGICA